jgi:hypothetical protein
MWVNMSSLFVLLVLLGAASLSCRLFVWFGAGESQGEVRLGAWIVLFFFVLYSEFMLLGLLGLYRPWPLVVVGTVFIIGGGTCFWDTVRRGIGFLGGLSLCWPCQLCLTLLLPGLLLSIPGVIGHADITYHLPAAMYFVWSGETSGFDPRYLLLGPDACTNYFMRGHDLILSIIFFSRCPKAFLVLLKGLELTLLVCSIMALVGNRRKGWLIAALVASTDVVFTDVNNLKNDLFIGALVLFVMALLWGGRSCRLWPCVAIATALVMASKSNGLLYLGPFIIVYAGALFRQGGRLVAWALLCCWGGVFYVINWVHTGNPVHPFSLEFALLGKGMGTSNVISNGSILQNFDCWTIPLLLRGMARAMSPVHVLVYLALVIRLVSGTVCAIRARSFHPAALTSLGVVAYAFFVYTITPHSDSNAVRHDLLFSGNNLRYNLVCWCLLPCVIWRGHDLLAANNRWDFWLAAGAIAGVLSNHLSAVILKPELAFPAIAPVFMTDNAWILFLIFLVTTLLCFFILRQRRWWVRLGGMAVVCVIVAVLLPDKKFEYSETLRRMPGKTRLVEMLSARRVDCCDRIILVAPDLQSNMLLGCVMEYACTWFKHVRLKDAWPAVPASLGQVDSCMVACARVDTTIASMFRGRTYQLSFDYLEGAENACKDNLSYQDHFYKLFFFPRCKPRM